MTTAITVTDEQRRSDLAYKIQGILADELWADAEYDINGTGPASFKIADIVIAALSTVPSAGEPVAYTSQFQLDGMIKNPSGNFVMWGELRPDRDDIPLFTHPSPSASEAQVRVKALEWEEREDNSHRGRSAIGYYHVFPGTGFSYDLCGPVGGRLATYKRLADAKAAAQSDYERRVLSALTPEQGETEAARAAKAEGHPSLAVTVHPLPAKGDMR